MKKFSLRHQCMLWMVDPPEFPSQIARRFDANPGSVAKAMMRLEQDGLVKGSLKLASEDHIAGTVRYARAYQLTDAGRQWVAKNEERAA